MLKDFSEIKSMTRPPTDNLLRDSNDTSQLNAIRAISIAEDALLALKLLEAQGMESVDFPISKTEITLRTALQDPGLGDQAMDNRNAQMAVLQYSDAIDAALGLPGRGRSKRD